MIGKPTGPDLTSQVLADQGESVTILDMEAWPDARQDSKDVMYDSEFGELQLHNAGWGWHPSWTVDCAALPLPRHARAAQGRGYQAAVRPWATVRAQATHRARWAFSR